MNDDQTYDRVDRFNRSMTITNVAVSLLNIAISAMVGIGVKSVMAGGKQLFYVVGSYSILAF